MNRFTKISILLMVCLLTCVSFAPSTYADVEIVKDISKSEIGLYSEHNLLVEKKLLANAEFDLRDVIDMSRIVTKNQQNTQHCWAFASNTVLETNLLLTKQLNYDFSERHMAYATARNFTDGTNELGHNREPSTGANEFVALAYYISGRGPIPEEEMPFISNVGRISLSEIEGKTVQIKVTDYIEFPAIEKQIGTNGNYIYTNPNTSTNEEYTETEVQAIRNNIKNHIMNYGAVFATTVASGANNQYYNYELEEPALYCYNNNVEPNHQIAIIGWDDGYAIENFNEGNRPTSPGAYLAVNSYGQNGQFKTGCFYISYEDRIIEKYGMVGIINAENIDYDKIYQYDPLGYSNSISVDDKTVVYGANVFKKDPTTIEKINEISVSSVVDQQFELYINSQDGELNLDKMQRIETEQTSLRAGYTTIKLQEPIKISGEEFAVAIKYIGVNRSACIGVETPNDLYWATATSNDGESYYSFNGETWLDLNSSAVKNTNICIKAFTTIENQNIISNSYIIEGGLIYKVSPNTTVSTFKQNVQSGMTLKAFRNDIELAENDIITTGTILKVGEDENYVIAVKGDITGNGQITQDDITQIKLYLLGRLNLTKLGEKAADVNTTRSVTLTDLTQMKAAILGLINL